MRKDAKPTAKSEKSLNNEQTEQPFSYLNKDNIETINPNITYDNKTITTPDLYDSRKEKQDKNDRYYSHYDSDVQEKYSNYHDYNSNSFYDYNNSYYDYGYCPYERAYSEYQYPGEEDYKNSYYDQENKYSNTLQYKPADTLYPNPSYQEIRSTRSENNHKSQQTSQKLSDKHQLDQEKYQQPLSVDLHYEKELLKQQLSINELKQEQKVLQQKLLDNEYKQKSLLEMSQSSNFCGYFNNSHDVNNKIQYNECPIGNKSKDNFNNEYEQSNQIVN